MSGTSGVARPTAAGPARWFDRLNGLLAPAAQSPQRLAARDLPLALLLGTLAAALSAWAIGQYPDATYGEAGYDVWFQADQPRILGALSDRTSVLHYRNSVHPLFSLLAYPFVRLLEACGLSTLAAGLALMATAAFLCAGLLYLALRHAGLAAVDATLACLVFVSSATFVHWFGLLETYPLSALSAIVPIWIMARARAPGLVATVATSAVSLSMVVTNWALGLLLTATRLPLGRFVRGTLLALALCIGAALVQKALFPRSGLFFAPASISDERAFAGRQNAVGMIETGKVALVRWQAFLIGAAVAPRPVVEAPQGKQVLNNQRLGLSGYDGFGLVGIAAWVGLLACGLRALVEARLRTPLLAAAAGFLLAQMALFSVYGEVTFLYAANYFIVMVVFCAHGALGAWHGLYRAVAVLFVMAAGVANLDAFLSATRLLKTLLGN